MGFLVGYLLGFAIICSIRFYKMECIRGTKIVLCSLLYPVEILSFLLNILLIPCGICLEFKVAVILNEKEAQAMTDKSISELSDRLKDMMEESEDDDGK